MTVSCSRSSTLSTYAVMSVTSTAYSSSHSCVGVPGGGGGGGVPVEPRPRDVGQVVLEGPPVLGGPLLASWVGWWRRRALDRCVQGARSRGGGGGGALCGLGSAGPLAAGSSSGGLRSI